MKFTMTTPCDNCPFRYDVRPYIHAERVLEIHACNDGGFPCHKTVDYSEETEEGEPIRTNICDEIHCAGSLILQAKEGVFGQMARIAMRCNSDGNGLDPDELDMGAPVYDDWDSMYEAHADAETG